MTTVARGSSGPATSSEPGSRLPTFLVIGAMKAGTTSLFHYLDAHPAVYMSPLKEVDFFSVEGNWRRGRSWYERQFAAAPPAATALGEASTVYTKYPKFQGVPERIADVLPDVRLVYVVRDPVARIRSHYEHRVAVGAERLPLERALRENPIYLDYSRYAMQLERYTTRFPRDRILVITSEALRRERGSTLATVYGFLGVDPSFVPPNIAEEYYATDARVTWSPAMWRIRRSVRRVIPGAKRMKEFADHRLGPVIGRRASSSLNAEMTPELRARIAEELSDDVRSLRSFLPAAFDGWGIA